MKIFNNDLPWTILLGGKGREHTAAEIAKIGLPVKRVIIPKKSMIDHKILKETFTPKVIDVLERDKTNEKIAQCASNIFSIGWPYLLPPKLITDDKLYLNIHPTLLPKYAGVTSGAYVLINDEKITGSTIHLITAVPDGGEVFCQSKVPISKFDTLRSMQRKVYSAEPALVREFFNNLTSNFGVTGVDPGSPDFYPPRTPKDSEIDASKPLIALFDTIRAADPEKFPAFFYVNGEKVNIKMWRERANDNEYCDML